uniref:Uncharacterized protein n=1 Tax=Lepeophtheirus salmonis TaxID=72036 RepID=A0A0K2U895_LEPSM
MLGLQTEFQPNSGFRISHQNSRKQDTQ